MKNEPWVAIIFSNFCNPNYPVCQLLRSLKRNYYKAKIISFDDTYKYTSILSKFRGEAIGNDYRFLVILAYHKMLQWTK